MQKDKLLPQSCFACLAYLKPEQRNWVLGSNLWWPVAIPLPHFLIGEDGASHFGFTVRK